MWDHLVSGCGLLVPLQGTQDSRCLSWTVFTKNDKPDTRNKIKTFSHASVFQATSALCTCICTGVLLWRDDLVCVVFTWLLPFVINFDILYRLSMAFFHVSCSRIPVSVICTIKKEDTFTCNISGFCRRVVEAFALLGCYAA